MISIGICDDEANMRKSLRRILERTLQLQGIEYRILEYASGEELLLAKEAVAILFLDIEMSGMNGIETAGKLRKTQEGTVLIFVTAYPDFVFQGYDVHAFYYVLKPYEDKKIEWVTMQALKELQQLTERIFTVENKGMVTKLPFKEIIAFASEGRKLLVMTTKQNIEFYGKLSEIEAELPEYFIRIHNRYIVNLHHVTGIAKERCVVDENTFPISRTYKQGLEVAFAREMLH